MLRPVVMTPRLALWLIIALMLACGSRSGELPPFNRDAGKAQDGGGGASGGGGAE